MSDEILKRIGAYGVIPVLAVERADSVIGLGDALLSGGLPVAEITFRTAAAADAIRMLRRERPQILVGAGTVLTADSAVLAKESGAQFLVAPGLNPAVVRRAEDLELPMVPGIMTPSEVEQALVLGCRVLKFFPAEVAGGLKMLRALAGPYAHAGVRFVPTGGVTAASLAAYMAEKTVLAVGGTWIAKKDEVAAGKWDEIAARCREAMSIVAGARGGAKEVV